MQRHNEVQNKCLTKTYKEMKKLFLLAVAAMMSVSIANAQVPVKYQGEVDLGYSIGVGTIELGRVNLHTVHGVKIGNYFSTGIGLGLDYYHDIDKYMRDDWSKGELILPIYLDLTGYVPASDNVSLLASFDIGAGIGVTEGVSGYSGLYLTLAVGVKVNKFKVQLGYTMQDSGNLFDTMAGAIQIKVGVVF